MYKLCLYTYNQLRFTPLIRWSNHYAAHADERGGETKNRRKGKGFNNCKQKFKDNSEVEL